MLLIKWLIMLIIVYILHASNELTSSKNVKLIWPKLSVIVLSFHHNAGMSHSIKIPNPWLRFKTMWSMGMGLYQYIPGPVSLKSILQALHLCTLTLWVCAVLSNKNENPCFKSFARCYQRNQSHLASWWLCFSWLLHCIPWEEEAN